MKRRKCQAIVDHVPKIPLAQIPKPYEKKPCPRKATGKVGRLCLCTTHVRMAVEGLMDDAGIVACHEARRTASRYRRRFPNGLYDWARKLKPKKM